MRTLNVGLALIGFSLAHGQTKQYTCAACHAKEALSQPSTPMGRALLPPGNRPNLGTEGKLSFQSGRFSYLVESKSGETTYTVTDGEHSLSLPIHWTFGEAAQTYVLTHAGVYFESMVSYYPEIGKLDFTLGDQGLNPQSLEGAIGRRIDLNEVTSCFGCHSTHSLTDRKLDLQALAPGVTCEHCHIGAQIHLGAMNGRAHVDVKTTMPRKIGSSSAEAISNFCGQCHRSWETVVRNNLMGQINVRFQPYRLASSQCFNGTDPRISCLACHNPHEDLVKDDTKYDSKCLACHSGSEAPKCKVAQTGCTTCHMPKVSLPGGHQTFTDHDIRVVKPGESYPN